MCRVTLYDGHIRGENDMTIQERNAKFQATFEAGGINVRKVRVLGGYVHVDTFEKYADKLDRVMGPLGFRKFSESNGVHMDGIDGFRLVYKLA
jgi:hypothetical protein